MQLRLETGTGRCCWPTPRERMPGQGGPKGAPGVGPPQAVTRSLTARLPETAKVKQRYACLLEGCGASCCAVHGVMVCSQDTQTWACCHSSHVPGRHMAHAVWRFSLMTHERQRHMLCSLLTCSAVLKTSMSIKNSHSRGAMLLSWS